MGGKVFQTERMPKQQYDFVCDKIKEVVGTVDGIPVVERRYDEVENVLELPCDPFLVSSMILDRLPKEYSGVAFAPDTGLGAIRDDKGHIVATSRLITI